MEEWAPFPLAVPDPGPSNKVGYAFWTGTWYTNLRCGVVIHSSEGTLAATLGELHNPLRQASWHFTIPKVGKALQHYAISACLWHCGQPNSDTTGIYAGNVSFIGIEVCGWAGEPWTPKQLTSVISILRWLHPQLQMRGPWTIPAPEHRFPNVEIPLTREAELWEHGWIMATACPSGRNPWNEILGALRPTEEDDMFTEEDRQMMKQILDRSKRVLVRIQRRQEIYNYDEDGPTLVHIPVPELLKPGGYSDSEVAEFPADHLIWNTQTLFPTGVPNPLRPG